MKSQLPGAIMIFAITVATASRAACAPPLTITIAPPKAHPFESYQLGTTARPDGTTLAVDPRSLLLNGERWMPAMGEMHYTRSPENEWREELLKIKAGGIDIVATYVFWIHHEEVEGQWDWSGRRNLREFVRLAGEVGLKVVVRCGPWCHGEVRNGGLPDWTLNRGGWRVRSQEAGYLDRVRVLYGRIAQQLAGQLWKDGGSVIGIKLDNEYDGPADIETPVLIKLGSGSTLPGYDMYQGGMNPDGKLTTLMEAQATAQTNWNDLPVKNYDSMSDCPVTRRKFSAAICAFRSCRCSAPL